MKFSMISQCGEGAGVLLQLQEEGNDVELYIEEKLYDTVYDGILPKSYDLNNIDEDSIVIFDMSGNGGLADELKKDGFKVFGASEFADDLETDRQFGLDIMRRCGIKLPETEEFESFEDAGPYLDKHPDKRFVFKPSGKMPCKLTYCSENNEELLKYMTFVNEQFGDKIDSFVLQEFIKGDVVSTEIFFDGDKIVGIPNHTVEVKKFMNDDLGPSTGCMGNIVWLAEDSKIAREGVELIEDMLRKENYVGQCDLNTVVNEQGIWGLEWTPRFGYDATPVYLKMLGIEYGKFFSDIVNGDATNWPHCKESMCGIRFTIPPFPAEPEGEEDEEEVQRVLANFGVPIHGIETFNKDLYLYEVMKNDNGEYVHSDGLGVIGLAIKENPKHCYEILEKIKIPDKQYRTDLVEVLTKMRKGAEKYA